MNSSTVRCLGKTATYPAETLFNHKMVVGKTDVWYFDYDKNVHEAGQFSLFDGELKTFTLSVIPNDFNSVELGRCYKEQASITGPISYTLDSKAEIWHCGLTHGKRYYLNIKPKVPSSQPDQYTLAGT